MFTLIKRELYPLAPILIILLTYLVIFLIIMKYQSFSDLLSNDSLTTGIAIFLLAVLPLTSGVAGAALMNLDRKNRHSTFLCTLPTSRGRIFLARCLVGTAFYGTGVFLMVLTLMLILSWQSLRLLTLNVYPIGQLFLISLPASIINYAFGLLVGWSSSLWRIIAGGLGLAILADILIVIKGLTSECALFLAVLAVAAFFCAWKRYRQSPLA